MAAPEDAILVRVNGASRKLPAGVSLLQLVEQLGLDRGSVRGHFQDTEHELRIFLTDGQEARLDMRTGRGQIKVLDRRPVLFEVNTLHLNNLKGIWTWVADLFAIALIVLAITGTTMLKGELGITGRGKYFIAAGLAVPIGFVIYMHT